MKSLFTAVAAAPLLIACTTASASEMDTAEREMRVLVVNGHEYILEDGDEAARIVAEVIEDEDFEFDFDLDFDVEGEGWSEEERAAFEAEMEALGEQIGEIASAMVSVRVDDGDHMRIRMARMEEMHEAHAARLEAHAERMAERAEAMAARAEARGEQMRIVGLSAGLSGMESGLAGIDRALDRGWVYDEGERRDLTAEEIEELREARADLAESLAEFRAEHADVLPLLENADRRRVYLRRLRAEAPDAPDAPQAPDEPSLEGGR